ncbi:MAG: S-methyl-5'-thioadenosine phosphorylase [Candidatus Geothermincolia bacterium]
MKPIGIVGGSGLYQLPDLEITSRERVDTPFGDPSDHFVIGRLKGADVVFLSRHGEGHKVVAPGVNFRANIYGFKSLGVETLIGVSAVGSLREELAPRHMIIPDQIIDLTKGRESTFFKDNPAVHVSMADPTCANLNKVLFECAESLGVTAHLGGTYVCMEGPAFSTRAESNLYRSWNADVIGMTAATEAKLCREAEICYSALALVTDYDVWREDTVDVTIDIIIQHVRQNAETAAKIVKEAILKIPDLSGCPCRHALATAIGTDPAVVPDVTRTRLRVLLSKYMPPRD